jgi:Na+-translocating ferredoxin:NAD+ oxidoreductase RnfE subunit
MNPEVLKTNTLSIAIAGLLILLTGLGLYLFRNQMAGNIRFFMPIPPLGVAAYIFVFNMYSHYEGQLPEGNWVAAKELLYSTAIASISFGVFAFLIMVIIGSLRR